MPAKIRMHHTVRRCLFSKPVRRSRDDDITRRAFRISREAAALGFDWSDAAGVIDKLEEEVSEIRAAFLHPQYDGHLPDEIGDLFFALINFSRKANISPEAAFKRGVDKFVRRFNALKKIAHDLGHRVESLDANALDALWARVKQEENLT